MSRIGRKPVTVPGNVKATVKDGTVTLQGPAGTLSMKHRPEVGVKWNESEKAISCSIEEKDAENSEVRVHRGGMAALSAMFSRAFVQDLRQARKNGSYPTVDDPTRAAR